jgi:hypothetical protein
MALEIVADSQTKAAKLPDMVVRSYRGKPWLLTECPVRSVEGSLRSVAPVSYSRPGTARTAKEMATLFR